MSKEREGQVLRISVKPPGMDREEGYQGAEYHRVGTFHLASYRNRFFNAQ